MTTLSKEPTFLYPTSRQFPFDAVCEQIVRTLEARNWDVPGVKVEFDVYGSGDAKYRMARTIEGDDFKLWFYRAQGHLSDRLNNSAAISQINIPKLEITVFEDESGPSFYTYVGDNWDRDKSDFVSGFKVISKLYELPRTYLKYTGACDCGPSIMRHTHSNRRSPLLVHDDNLGREYSPQDNDPMSYKTEDVFRLFVEWLTKNVLAKILDHPVADRKIDIFFKKSTPFVFDIGPIFCYGDSRDAKRINQGNLDATELAPEDRYAFNGSGTRLLSYGIKDDGTVPKIAYDGFLWCGLGDALAKDLGEQPAEVFGRYRTFDNERFMFSISPNCADDVYIADHEPFLTRHKELFETIKPRQRLTDDELNEVYLARARTILPINEYTGGYKKPIILIGRELGFDEVKLLTPLV